MWDPVQRCFRPDADAWGASSVDGVSITGDGAGILGAEAAAFSGRIAALSALCRLGRIDEAERDILASMERVRLSKASRGRRFIDLYYQPSATVPSDATKACRCEEVTVAQIRHATAIGAVGPNQMKSFLRCGMGPCQGRLLPCGIQNFVRLRLSVFDIRVLDCPLSVARGFQGAARSVSVPSLSGLGLGVGAHKTLRCARFSPQAPYACIFCLP